MNVLLRQATGRLADTNGNGSYPPDSTPVLPGARFPVDRRPNPTYNDEGIDITNQPLYNGPARDNSEQLRAESSMPTRWPSETPRRSSTTETTG
jgi:hypothetical protein